MILSGLIFLPLAGIPTVALLKKDFQIKVFYSLVAFIHFVFSLGVLTRYGYFFKGVILSEQISLYGNLGLNYSVSLNSTTLLAIVAINFAYLLLGALSISESVRKEAVLLFSSQILTLLALLSDNLLTTTLALFLLTLSCSLSNHNYKKTSDSTYRILFLALASLVGVSLILGILHESVFGFANLDIKSLSEMRTPFVKGSLYSTQFVLFLFYCIGFTLLTVVNFINLSCGEKGILILKRFSSFIGILLSLYASTLFSFSLFPEVSKIYLPSLQSQGLIVVAVGILLVLAALASHLFNRFFRRAHHV